MKIIQIRRSFHLFSNRWTHVFESGNGTWKESTMMRIIEFHYPSWCCWMIMKPESIVENLLSKCCKLSRKSFQQKAQTVAGAESFYILSVPQKWAFNHANRVWRNFLTNWISIFFCSAWFGSEKRKKNFSKLRIFSTTTKKLTKKIFGLRLSLGQLKKFSQHNFFPFGHFLLSCTLHQWKYLDTSNF